MLGFRVHGLRRVQGGPRPDTFALILGALILFVDRSLLRIARERRVCSREPIRETGLCVTA